MSRQWYEYPSLVLQLANLSKLRDDLRKNNLFEAPGIRPKVETTEPPPEALRARLPDGSWNDLSDPQMGAKGTGFGRNVPLAKTKPDRASLLDPNPRDISEKLMARDTFKPAGIINALAAAWLQFENHNWFFHGSGVEDGSIEIPLRDDDDWPDRPMRIRKTPLLDPQPAGNGQAPIYVNQETHWWDASQIYGSGPERQAEIRTFVDGKVRLGDDLRLPKSDEPGIDLTGMKENWWVGVGLLHTLFAREHNSVCDAVKKAHPELDDQRLFEIAWLVVAALIAKIHTVEWTTCVLRHPALQIGMNANWYGALGETFKDQVGRIGGSEVLSGIIGSPMDHHSAPFSLTEEFTSVYRMHPLIPDDWEFRSLASGELIEEMYFTDIQGKYTRDFMDRYEMGDMWYTFGVASAGAVCLHNYPNALRKLTRVDGQITDLATLDIVRDRERGVPRYNDFREAINMPRRKKFSDLTPNKQWAAEIADMYKGDIDRVDLQVGMYAEKPPKGFGFSDTAFRIFILMASRRFKSDRFFTKDFRPEIYTKVGFDWVNNTTMKDVLLRHYPELTPEIKDVERIFAPWGTAPGSKNPISRVADTVMGYMPFGN